MKKGKFIVFEGLDGSGQSTQIALLEQYLKNKGRKVFITSEPSNNVIGGLIRSILKSHIKLSNTGVQLLYCADRAHHLEVDIVPALEAGIDVITSRFYFSTLAFGSLNNDVKWLKALNEKFPDPDIAIFLKVPPKECMRRINGSRFRTELFEKEQKLTKAYKTYLKIAKDKDYKSFVMVDGNRAVEQVAQDICNTIDKIIK